MSVYELKERHIDKHWKKPSVYGLDAYSIPMAEYTIEASDKSTQRDVITNIKTAAEQEGYSFDVNISPDNARVYVFLAMPDKKGKYEVLISLSNESDLIWVSSDASIPSLNKAENEVKTIVDAWLCGNHC